MSEAFLAFVRETMSFACHHCNPSVGWDELRVPEPSVDAQDTATFHLYCSDACADTGCSPAFCADPRPPN